MTMPIVIRNASFAALALLLLSGIGSNAALAQGSSGGSIGNDDKSVSGSRPEPRSVEPERPARRSKPEAEAPQRASRKNGGGGVGGGNFNGTWAYVGVGSNCKGTGSGTFTVSGSRVTGAGGGGSVSPSGAINTHGVGDDGVSITASGRLSGNSGGGSYMRADGCGGRWSATRQ